jgi:hypothetical protein
MEQESTVIRADEQRVLAVTHYFLDPVREYSRPLRSRMLSETQRRGMVGR